MDDYQPKVTSDKPQDWGQPQMPPQPQPVQPQAQAQDPAVGQVVQSGVLPQQGQPQPTVGGMHKEQVMVPPVPEHVPLVEVGEYEKIPEEVESWMEKLEQAGEIKIPEAIKKDEQVLLDNATPTTVRDTVVLPLTHSGAAVAAKKKTSESARWLYEWCARLLKILKDRAKYAEG